MPPRACWGWQLMGGASIARVAVVGCVGIPNRYGGFESFAEHISPALRARGMAVSV